MVTKPRQYQLIYESLKRQLVEGIYPKGSLLPSENELSVTFQTTRMTVRQALTELVREGFIERRHGKGSIVRSERQALGLLSFQGFSEVVGNNHVVRTEFLAPLTLMSWPTDFFYNLTDTERNLDCLFLHRLRYADNNPIMLEHTFVPDIGLDSLQADGLLDGSLFRTLSNRYQLDIRNMEQRLRAVKATIEQAHLFGCTKNTPLLYIERRYLTNRPNLNVYSRLFCFTDHYAISGGL
ncbi:GntR family transcriptional regulator [Spirosoma sp. HMF4905]|uniref:GntR family transcriptional regulator n=1 Tax=Spirosoma arboris TaxID=2682092 RepID=A0A7K1SAA7_9BACT|nr:GntR family transcriptional regulator [Spirosoma arboris]MVM30598.1 GntR family transcriptional regulator [Spirosoma arboris]